MNDALTRAAALACADVYAAAPTGFTKVWDFGGTVAALRVEGSTTIIVFRGSLTVTDWIRDVEVLPFWEPRLGFVHGGFMVGVNDVFVAASLQPEWAQDVMVVGHSLGGARARLFAALMAYYGRPATRCIVFGSPRPAFANVRRLLEKSGTALESYRNRNDPVPLVPFLGGLYEHTDQWLAVNAAPESVSMEPLRDHHMALYQRALADTSPKISGIMAVETP